MNTAARQVLLATRGLLEEKFIRKVTTTLGLVTAILFTISFISYRSLTTFINASNQVTYTQEFLTELEDLVSHLKAAETGQRGYLLTGKERYLEPYSAAVREVEQGLKALEKLTAAHHPDQQQQFQTLELIFTQKLTELKQTIELRQDKGLEAALQVVQTDRGKNLMDDIRRVSREMENEEKAVLKQYMFQSQVNSRQAIFTFFGGICLTFSLLAGVYYLIYREIGQRQLAEAALRESKRRLQQQNLVLVELARSKTLNRGDLSAAVKEIIEATTNTLRVERASVWLYKDERSKIHCIDMYESSASGHSQGIELAAVDYPAYFHALKQERTIAAHNAHTDPRTKEFSQFYLSPLGITSMLDAPIWLDGETVGVVCHEHVGPVREWTLEEQNFAGSIADLVSMAMQARDRKQAEEVHCQLAAIVESSDDAIISKTLDGMIISWNSSAERIYGYTAEEVKNRHGSILVPPERLNEEPQILQRIRQGERIENYETVRVRKDGRQIDVSLTISPVKDAAGNTIGVSKIARDITQHKQVEAELAKRERYLAALVEVQRRLLTSEAPRNYYTKVLEPLGQAAGASRVYVFENHQDAAGRLLMSQRAEWCHQDIQAEIDNPNLQNLAYDDFFPRWTQALAQGEIIAGKVAEFPESEQIILMPQGILSILILPLMVNGKFFGFIGFDNCLEASSWEPLEVNLLAVAAAAISLTHERKRAEEARRESQQMLQLVMDNIPQFIYWKDRNSVYLGCNRNFSELAGVGNPENIVGKTDYDLPWKKEEANFFHERDRQVMETNTPKYHVVETLIRGDGQQIWLGTNKVPLHDSEGNVVGLLGTFADITERKRAAAALSESQRKLATLIDSLPGIVFSCAKDPNWTMTYLSEGCLNLTGYTSEELLGNREVSYNSITSTEDFPNVLDAINTAITLKQPYVVEYRIRTKSGEEKWLWEKGSGVFNSNGEVLGLEGFITDITELKQADEKIKASLKEKEVLLKEIHHRVKNNLQIISSLLKLQSGYIKDKHTLEMFKDSQSRIRSMALIHEKLYQSQDLSKVNFAEYITSLAANLFRSYELATTTINPIVKVENIFLEIDVAVPCGLIINELVSNSLKYAFPDRREGEIQIHLYFINEHEIKLIISDNGIGLPKDFDFQNTGTLGLQLVNNLVEQLEGTIEVNGHSGTEFRIKFAI